MKRILIALFLMIGAPLALFGQAPLNLSELVSTVAPPANTTLSSGFGLLCTGSAGSFAANTYVVAYTYTGTASSSESKASSDGGAVLTTLVTCPANGTLTIPSPPSPPGCSNCIGWRPYVVASSSGTGAELLQTIAATNCPLAVGTSLTSCQLNQPFTETSLGAGAAEPTNPTLFTPASPGTTGPLNEIGLSIGQHYLYWTVTGTAATCTVQIETATTQTGSFSLMTGSAAQTCTSSGVYQVNNQTANFVRLNLTAFTATGANIPTIAITLIDTPNTPIGGSFVFCPLKVCVPVTTLGNLKVASGFCLAAAATTCVVSGISPAFTSTTSYACSVTDQTTAANNALTVTNTSASSITITTSSSSDTFSYICIGN